MTDEPEENDITDDLEAHLLYRGLKDAAKAGLMDEYSYLEFDKVEINDQGGVDTVYKLVESDEYELRKRDKSKYQWSPRVVEKFPDVNKESAGKSVKVKEKEAAPPPSVTPSAAPVISGRGTRLDELVKYKESLISDIRFAKEIGMDPASDMAKYQAVKAQIDDLMK